jgi:hypothetical protein
VQGLFQEANIGGGGQSHIKCRESQFPRGGGKSIPRGEGESTPWSLPEINPGVDVTLHNYTDVIMTLHLDDIVGKFGELCNW